MGFTSTANIDGVDLPVVSVVAREGDPLGVRRVRRVFVVRMVFSELDLALSAEANSVDFPVVSIPARIDNPLGVWRVGWLVAARIVLGDWELARSVGVNRVDVLVVCGGLPPGPPPE